ncbi:MAG TPA: MMPL family transporter [Turneriella sp.]|nr:MMPL family transporter [Turneriella sp.]
MPEKKLPLLSRLNARFWPFWLYHVRKLAWPVIAFLLVTSIVGFRYGRKIRIDTNLMHLLPADTASLKALKKMSDESDVKGFLVFSLIAATPQKEGVLLQAAQKIEQGVLNESFLKAATQKIIYRVPNDFLTRYSLYYADIDDLRKVEARLIATIRKTKQMENPYFEDLENSSPARFYIGDILNKYRTRYSSTNAFISNDFRQIAILLALNETPENIGFASRYLTRLKALAADDASLKNFTVSFSGSYATNVEKQKHLQSDINQSTTITLLILISSLIVFFRSLRVVLVIGLPITAALGYTYHAAWFFIGEISIISSFLTSILLGLGIDYGIHLFARYKNERLKGNGMTQALEATMRNLFRGLSFGMITTASVFLTLSFSRFIAFAEFGKIAFAGIVFFFLSFILFFPALVFVTERFSSGTTEPSHILQKTRKTRGWHILLAVCILGYGIFTLTRLPFEYNFFKLDSSLNASLVKKGNESLRVLENREYMVIYELNNLEEVKAAETNLRARKTGIEIETHSMLDLIPTGMNEKRAALSRIHSLLKQAELYYLVTGDVKNVQKVEWGLSMTAAPPLTIQKIPEEFREHLVRNGKYYLYIFPKNTKKLKRGALDFAAAYRTVCVQTNVGDACPTGALKTGVSDIYVIDDILQTVMHDIVTELVLIVLVIAAIVLSLTRRAAGVTLILAPLVAGVLALFAFIGISYQFFPVWLFQFNYINLLAVPILLGVGIDNGIYLYSHTRELGLSQTNQIMAKTGASIFISNFTTAMGFLSLTISNHKGLASFGFITFAGMVCIFIAYRLLYPALVRFFEKLDTTI